MVLCPSVCGSPISIPAGNGLITTARLRGQQGAATDAPLFAHIAVPGVAAGLMRDLNANPLDFVDTEATTRRRRELSEILDSASPDLTAFHRRQGQKMIVVDWYKRHAGFARGAAGLLPIRDR
jgi:hypothetical protein